VRPDFKVTQEIIMSRSLIASLVGAALLSLAGTAQASLLVYNASLSGPNEGNVSPGLGFATITFDDAAHTMLINASFSGLTGLTTASHIHCCTAAPGTGTAGVATQVPTFTGFPLNVTSGAYSNTFDLTQASSWNPAFVTANGGTPASAEAALLGGAAAGTAYLNIHTTLFPGGEIRGFLTAVPEPATWALMILGVALVGGTLRRRQPAMV
jgi:hypothetical protein